MQRDFLFGILLCTACSLKLTAQEVPTTLIPSDLKIVQRIADHEKLDSPPASVDKGWPLKKGEKGIRFASNENPRHALTVVPDANGRVTKLLGNGPLLCNDALKWAAELQELRVIRIDHNIPHPGSKTPHMQYDGSGFSAFKTGKLEEIRIGHAFDDLGMAALAQVKSLRMAIIVHSKATDLGIKHFENHPNLEEFEISSQGRANRVTEKSLPIFATLPKLKRLALHETFLTYDQGLKHLAPLKGRLETVSLKGSLVLPEDIDRLRRDHPNMTIVTSTPAEILDSPNSRGVLKWASPKAIEYLTSGKQNPPSK
ncbi:MAG: hypothetical protein R3B84_02855 [Zavarzinella sp.]